MANDKKEKYIFAGIRTAISCMMLTVMFIFCYTGSVRAERRYLQPDDTHILQTDESVDEVDETGQLDGLCHIGNKIYYYVSGDMQTGWQEIGGQKYYFSVKSGAALKGKQKIGNDFYYFRPDGTMQTGWVKSNGRKYYFSEENGKMQTGWQKIDGCKYYLDTDGTEIGALQTDCIAGTKKTGVYYVGADGVQVTDPEIKAAVTYVRKYTKDNWPDHVKLQKCYQALRDAYHYQASQETPTAQKLSGYAYDLLTNGRGNCYRYAAGFACIAKVLGYESRINIGNVSGRYGAMTPHGWAEVKSDGIWHKCDVNMNLYMHAGATSRRYERKEVYKLVVREGKASWK